MNLKMEQKKLANLNNKEKLAAPGRCSSGSDSAAGPGRGRPAPGRPRRGSRAWMPVRHGRSLPWRSVAPAGGT